MNNTDLLFERYMKDIDGYPLIDAGKEIELSKIIMESKDETKKRIAVNNLILGNLKLVVSCAIHINKMSLNMNDTNMSLMDMIQAGNIGLMKAAELFDFKKQIKFSSYAHLSIIRQIKRAIKESKFIRIPPNHYKIMYDMDEIYLKNDKIDNADMAKKLKIDVDTIKIIKRNKRMTKTSLEALGPIIDQVIDNDELENIDLNENIERRDIRNYLNDSINKLSPIFRDLLKMRFFGNEEVTLKQISSKYGVTRENIRQYLIRAVRNLKGIIDNDSEQEKAIIQKFIKKTNEKLIKGENNDRTKKSNRRKYWNEFRRK